MCPHCQSTAVRWEPTSGRGRVWSFIVAHPPLLPAYAAVAPYNAIIVELEEDPALRFAGNLVASADGEINEIDPATIVIGEPVRVVFHQVEDVFLPRWTRGCERFPAQTSATGNLEFCLVVLMFRGYYRTHVRPLQRAADARGTR